MSPQKESCQPYLLVVCLPCLGAQPCAGQHFVAYSLASDMAIASAAAGEAPTPTAQKLQWPRPSPQQAAVMCILAPGLCNAWLRTVTCTASGLTTGKHGSFKAVVRTERSGSQVVQLVGACLKGPPGYLRPAPRLAAGQSKLRPNQLRSLANDDNLIAQLHLQLVLCGPSKSRFFSQKIGLVLEAIRQMFESGVRVLSY